MAAGDIGDARLVHQADEVPLHFFGKVVVLLLPVAPEDRLEHILRIGGLLGTFAAKIYTGCNVENAGYSATNCAERTAFFKAVSEGEREFAAIAIVGGPRGPLTEYCSPCGVCRQVMAEFCDPDEFLVIHGKTPEDYKQFTLREMLPEGGFPAANKGYFAKPQA